MSDFNARDYANGYRDGRIEAADEITNLRAEVERLRKIGNELLDYIERTAPFFGMRDARAALKEPSE